MLGRLYSKVFCEEKSAFNASSNYYTVILNLSGSLQYHPVLFSCIDRYMGRSSYSVCDLKDILSDESVAVNALNAVMPRMGKNINTCFVILQDLSFDDRGEDIKKTVDVLCAGGRMTHGDKIVSVTVLPAHTDEARKAISHTEEYDLPDSVIRHYVSHSQYFGERVANDICALVLMHSIKATSDEVKRDFDITGSHIQTEIQSFSEDGRKRMLNRKKLAWSTVIASYSDNKMDFLRRYFLKLIVNAECIEQFDISTFCNAFYHQHFAMDEREMVDMLRCAVDRMPCVTSAVRRGDTTLQTYLNMCYSTAGYGGEKVLELTLRVNMLKNRQSSLGQIETAAEALMSKMGEYHTEHLADDAIEALRAYVGKQKKIIAHNKRDLAQYIETSNADENELNEYIRRYIRMDRELRKSEFWHKVSLYIQRNREEFEPLCQESAAMIRELEKYKGELHISDSENYGNDYSGTYPAKAILTAYENDAICQQCAAAYKHYERSMNAQEQPVSIGNGRVFDEIYQVNACFRRDYVHSFSVNGAFSISIKHRIGNYLMMCEAQDAKKEETDVH